MIHQKYHFDTSHYITENITEFIYRDLPNNKGIARRNRALMSFRSIPQKKQVCKGCGGFAASLFCEAKKLTVRRVVLRSQAAAAASPPCPPLTNLFFAVKCNYGIKAQNFLLDILVSVCYNIIGGDLMATSNEVKDRWNSRHYDDVHIRCAKGGREAIQLMAKINGMSQAAYIRHLIIQDAKRFGKLEDVSKILGGGG